MKTIVTVGNSKGGVGKSTIAFNLAVTAVHDGKRVLLIDSDTQGSSLALRSIRKTDDIKATSITTPTLHKDLEKLDFEFIIIDSGGRDTAVFRSAVTASDLLLIPVLPSVLDIWAAEDCIDIYKEATDYNSKLTAYFVLNQCMTRTVMTRELEESLEGQEISALESKLCARVDFKNSLMKGQGVIEYSPRSKAAKEFESLYQEIVRKGL